MPEYFGAPLPCAARLGQLDIVQALLGAGMHTELTAGKKRRTALHYATMTGHDSIIQALIAGGAHINRPDYKGVTALHLAVYHNHITVIRSLLAADADINSTTSAIKIRKTGWTPLMYAIEGLQILPQLNCS